MSIPAAVQAGSTYRSFDEFKIALERYEKETHTSWRMRSSHANKHHAELKYRDIRYICTHGGMPRCRSKGLRPKQHYLAIGCQAKFQVYAGASDVLKITSMQTDHNHCVGPDFSRRYAKPRKLTKDDKRDITKMLEIKVEPSNARDTLMRLSSKHILAKEINNLVVTKLRSAQKEDLAEDEYLHQQLLRLLEEDDKALIKLQLSDTDELEVLFVATSQMLASYGNFPEVVFVDGTTHKTNVQRFALYVFLVPNDDGFGQPVGFAFLRSDVVKQHVHSAIRFFSEATNGCGSTKTIFVDRDVAETSSCRELLPQAEISLCQFNVIRAVKGEIVKLLLPAAENQMLLAAFKDVVYAETTEQYCRLKQTLLETAPRTFSEYLESNWFHIPEMWVSAFREEQLTLGKNLTKRIGSFNNFVKFRLRHAFTTTPHLTDMLLLLLESVKLPPQSISTQYFHNLAAVDDMSEDAKALAASLSDEAVSLVLQQLQLLPTVSCLPESPTVTFDGGNGKIYEVSASSVCHCRFHTKHQLPCRHVLFCRRQNGLCFIDSAATPTRWLRTAASVSANAFAETDYSNVDFGFASASEDDDNFGQQGDALVTLTAEEKFQLTCSLCNELSSHLSQAGTEEFREKVDQLQRLFAGWKAAATAKATAGQPTGGYYIPL